MKCFWCGSTEAQELGKEMESKMFPERRREFCGWRCAVTFLKNTTDWKRDADFAIYNVQECKGYTIRNRISEVYYP